MLYKDLTPYMRKKFNRSTCVICGTPIFNEQPFIIHINTRGRYKIYQFAHQLEEDCNNGTRSQSNTTGQKASNS